MVAYALAGSMFVDLATEPLGDGIRRQAGLPRRHLAVVEGGRRVRARSRSTSELFRTHYADVFKGDRAGGRFEVEGGLTYAWQPSRPTFRTRPISRACGTIPNPIPDIVGARILGLFLDSITTDHISPAGSIKLDSPAGLYLRDHQVRPADFNQYGTRRGNHEVMMRGTFANIRIKNQMVPGVEGGVTIHHPSGERMPIYDAAMRYRAENVPLVVFAGHEYGTGSSRDWAAKGTRLLGVRAVIAQSFERIHRSNLVGMGVLPLTFAEGTSWQTPGPQGRRNGHHRRPRRRLRPRRPGSPPRSRERTGRPRP